MAKSQNIQKILNEYNINNIFRDNSKLNNFVKLGEDRLIRYNSKFQKFETVRTLKIQKNDQI